MKQVPLAIAVVWAEETCLQVEKKAQVNLAVGLDFGFLVSAGIYFYRPLKS